MAASLTVRLATALSLLSVLPMEALGQGSERRNRRCPSSGQDHDRAEEQLDALSKLLGAVPPEGDVAPLRRAYADLMAGPCFRFAADLAWNGPTFGSALSAKAWWDDGGEAWLRSQLAPLERVTGLDEKGREVREARILFPPDERKALTLDTASDHRLCALLCSSADEECGRETAGWVSRAERAFDAQLIEEIYEPFLEQPRTTPDPREKLARCGREAIESKSETRFRDWYHCVDGSRQGWARFPLGRFKAPRKGWLVIRGRRGHYQFCDEVRAYDLETGSAYVASSCSGLALRTKGSVDFERTDDGRIDHDVVGRLSPDNLREAAWMILLADEVERQVRPWSDTVTIPAGLRPEWVSDETLYGHGFLGSWSSSGQTTLAWAWVEGGKVLAQGRLTWPRSYKVGASHAADLLSIAEEGLRPGCPAASLPAKLQVGCFTSGVSALDADPASRAALERRLFDRLLRLRPAASCASGHGAGR